MTVQALNGSPPVIQGQKSVDNSTATPASEPVATSGDVFVGETRSITTTPSKTDFEAALRRILDVSEQNTLNKTPADVLKILQPDFDTVEAYFAANRPADEFQKTQGVWRQLWYINKDIRDRGPIDLQENRIFQYVMQDKYYNVSEAKFKLLGIPLFTLKNVLVGNFTLKDVATPANSGAPKLNVIDLEFGESRSGFGKLSSKKSIAQQVDEVVAGQTFTIKTPGPKGVKGELWNIFLGEIDGKEVRICRGSGGRTTADNEQYYVLVRDTA